MPKKRKKERKDFPKYWSWFWKRWVGVRGRKGLFSFYYSGAKTLFMFGLQIDPRASWATGSFSSFSLRLGDIPVNHSLKTHSRHEGTHRKTGLWFILGLWTIISGTLEVCLHQQGNESTVCSDAKGKGTLSGQLGFWKRIIENIKTLPNIKYLFLFFLPNWLQM